MIQTAHLAGWDAAGLLSLAEFHDGVKKGIWAVDVRSGEKQLLASDLRQAENDLIFGKWFFNHFTLEWGNRVLRSSIPCDLLVIDELGPLEFKLFQGWVSALEVIRTGQFKIALVIIRPELTEPAINLLHPDRTIRLCAVEKVHEKVLQYSSAFTRKLNAI